MPPPPASNYIPASPTYHNTRDIRRPDDRHKERDLREREAAAAEYKRRRNPDYVSIFKPSWAALCYVLTLTSEEKSRLLPTDLVETIHTLLGPTLTTPLTLREALHLLRQLGALATLPSHCTQMPLIRDTPLGL